MKLTLAEAPNSWSSSIFFLLQLDSLHELLIWAAQGLGLSNSEDIIF